jgi:hypothetical protein
MFHFTTRAKVSLKSTPSLYSNPHATNLTLSFSSRLGLYLVYATCFNWFLSLSQVYKPPSLIILNKIHFMLHGIEPSFMLWCLLKVLGSLIYVVDKINYFSNVDSYASSSKLIMPTKNFIHHGLLFISSGYSLYCL